MTFRWLACIVLSIVAAAAASPAPGAATVEIVSEVAVQTSTEKELALVLPQSFFRPQGQTGFSEPYIVELHYTRDGGASWDSAGFYKHLDKPIEFTAEVEARYGFFVTLVDRNGNIDAMPTSDDAPQVTVLVDWSAPKVKLLAPEGGEVVGGGAALAIGWAAEDSFFPAEPITIEYMRHGEDEWRPLAGPLENTGRYDWMPVGVSGRITLRVTAEDEAGHSTSDVCASPILVDTTPPEANLVGPRLAAEGEVVLDCSADDGDGSGVEQLMLWVTLDNGATWVPAGSNPAGEALKFTATSGDYGLYITAVDRAGNTTGQPPSGTAPDINLSIDTEMPQVRLDALSPGGSIRGGAETLVRWEAVAPKPSVRPVSIFLSPDDGHSWELVAADLENTGSYMWDVPRINSGRCRLKITMRDASGKLSEAESKLPFAVDSTRPTSAIGVAPPDALEPLGDLAIVMRPMGTSGEKEVEDPQGEARATAEANGERTVAADVAHVPEPTPAPEEPWTGPREEPFAQPPGPDATFEDLLKAGFAAYRAGQLNLAKEYLSTAADMATGDPRPHEALGRVYAKMAGFNYTSKKEAFEAAIYEFEKALELGGENADVLNDLGWILMKSKRYEDAEKTLRRATEIGDKAMYWSNLGSALKHMGETAQAAEAFEQALVIEPDMKEAHFFLGSLCSDAGDWEEAREHWKRAVDGYGPGERLGKVALAGLQKAREALGEVSPAPDDITLRERMDRVR